MLFGTIDRSQHHNLGPDLPDLARVELLQLLMDPEAVPQNLVFDADLVGRDVSCPSCAEAELKSRKVLRQF